MSLDRSEPVPSCASAVGQISPPEVAPNSQPASTKANGEPTSQSVAESQRNKKETDVGSSSAPGASESQAGAAVVASLEDNQLEDVSRSVSTESSSSSISRSSSSVSMSQKEAETK